jgi:hypothetical protein
MKARALLFFIALSFSLELSAQTLAGVWEGSFALRGSKKQKMNVRVELMETDGEYIGVIYSRGFDQNTSFGCDYLVGGRVYDGKISLLFKDIQRAVAMSKTECAYFRELYLTLPKNSSETTITGKWYWRGDEFDTFTASKTDSVVSELAKEEVDTYIKSLYDTFEKRNVLLNPENRLYQKAGEIAIDSTDIILEFSSIDNSKHDSISVLFNGDLIANDHDLTKRPLRIRLKGPVPGVNDVVVISQSIAQNKLNIKLVVKQHGSLYEYTLEPGFIRNSLLLLKRKEN